MIMEDRYKYSYLLGKSSKIDKSDKYTAYDNYVMYLAPSNVSGVDVCPFASAGCRKACLFTSGRGKFNSVQSSRIRRTRHYLERREDFMTNLTKEIGRIVKRSQKAAIRLDGTSDLNWLPFVRKILVKHPTLINYEYTKNPRKAIKAKDIDRCFITFSRSESNENVCKELLGKGVNVAVVFRKTLPATYWGYPVIDGDETDARFLDPQGVVVGLRAKGDAKKDKSGFVVDL